MTAAPDPALSEDRAQLLSDMIEQEFGVAVRASWADALVERLALAADKAPSAAGGVDRMREALPWPPTEQQLNEWLASIVEVWWSKSSADYIRSGSLTVSDIKAKYALRDILKPWAEAAYNAALATGETSPERGRG